MLASISAEVMVKYGKGLEFGSGFKNSKNTFFYYGQTELDMKYIYNKLSR